MGQQHDTPSMTGSHCLFASCVKEAQTPCLCTLSHPHQPGHPNPPESPLYISPPGPLCFPIAPTIKKKRKKETQQKAPCTLVQTQGERVRFRRAAMWPTTAEVRDPWTPSIRLSAPALASDTHKTPAKEWRHATGKCINVRQTLEPYKIIREALCPTLDMHAAQM